MKNFAAISSVGGKVMAVSGLILVLSILVSYPFASMFSLVIQLIGHIVTIVSAAAFKIGYIVFAIGRHGHCLEF
ncbi:MULTISPECIES: hypothetical protein [unclassified Oleiphilus]|uniref:hypothetical protein n=1 Tax=unclassified Oleiphilus TaxID=2631174 RepID=UPI000B1642A3|nr:MULTISPECIES: hypothetical protein [unclassified Oleiphilus]